MNDRGSTDRFDATHSHGDEDGLRTAGLVASAVRRRWDGGERPDLAGVLANHPELRQYKSIVLDLAYCEYQFRVQSGESLSADEFAGRFPSLQRSLLLLIEVHGLLSHDPMAFLPLIGEVRKDVSPVYERRAEGLKTPFRAPE